MLIMNSVTSLGAWAKFHVSRQNDDRLQISMEGIRILAKALEESGSRGISHVYVHSEGRIDALGRRNEDTRKVSCFVRSVGFVVLASFTAPTRSSWRFLCREDSASMKPLGRSKYSTWDD